MDLSSTVAIAETIHGWMTRRELEWLYETASSLRPGGTWVELGIWKGRSFFTVAMGLPQGSKLVAVDSFPPTVAALPFVPSRDWVRDHFHAVLKTVQRLREDLSIEIVCRDTAEAGSLFADGSMDVVWFDADHSSAGLARDFSAWIPKVKPGGLLCGHDYNHGFAGLVQLVDEVFPERAIVPETSIWQVQKGNAIRSVALTG
jgi:hypothetical protein